MNYSEHYSQQDIFAESRQWETNHAVLGTARKIDQAHDRDPERRLRIGYVSPNFRRHSVSYFLSPLIAGHDHRLFEVFCYAQVANPDNVTKRFRRLADGWCSTVGMTTSAIADRIRNDGIDILVDLAGHTANNRLLVFAERPAPVQVTWLGYPNTTGLSAMDYRLTDAVADPEGPGDNLHTETLIRLPAGFLCFTPAPETPPVTDPPVLANGHVTFGSFNNPSKVTASVVASWARILEAVPGSRLLLKNRSLADDGTRQRYSALFAERGISEERLIFHAWIASMSGHLGAYGRIDIGLDPFPYNGTTTTCEALWMGVPVITLQGDRHASRVGASILKTVGQGEMIADSVDDYVDAAVKLAENTDALTSLRRDLRPAMAASPLWDAAGFTRDVESAYRDMWRRWCHGA
jgi:predicted O-linked N-acetylglucosamine transferase (SPINDLY family)